MAIHGNGISVDRITPRLVRRRWGLEDTEDWF